MSTSVPYAALARLLTHNNRVHDLEEMLDHMQVPTDYPTELDPREEALEINPFAETQNEIDREARASLVTAWLAMPAAPEAEE